MSAHVKALIILAEKRSASKALVARVLTRRDLSERDRTAAEGWRQFLSLGEGRSLTTRQWKWARSLDPVPPCHVLGCPGKPIYRMGIHEYCAKHKDRVQGDIESQIAYQGYNERSDDIAHWKAIGDNSALNASGGKNSGRIERYRAR